MDVFLTGGTGFIGTALLPQLLAAGHAVAALARSDEAEATLTAAGATPVRGDLTDGEVLAGAASEADAVVHLGSPGDERSALVDGLVAGTLAAVLTGTGKPWLHTGGVWVHGNTGGVVEDEESAPLAPPTLTEWRPPIARRVRAAGGTVIAPGIVHGDGRGLPRVLLDGPRRDDALLFPGSGEQHWATIHVSDVASLYVAALAAAPGSYYLAVSGQNPTVREIAETCSRVAGLGGRVAPEPALQTAARLGLLAEALGPGASWTGRRPGRPCWPTSRTPTPGEPGRHHVTGSVA